MLQKINIIYIIILYKFKFKIIISYLQIILKNVIFFKIDICVSILPDNIPVNFMFAIYIFCYISWTLMMHLN